MHRFACLMVLMLAPSVWHAAMAAGGPPGSDAGSETGTSPREFQRAAFAYSEAVVRVRVGINDAVVLEELRGFKTARNVPLFNLPANEPLAGPGHDILVAGRRCKGASPALWAMAWLPDTKENRDLVDEWALPAWNYTPMRGAMLPVFEHSAP